MKYCLLQGNNIIVKEEEGWKLFCPYTGDYDENDISLHDLDNINMTEVSSEKAENYVKAAKIAKAAHKGQKDKGGEDYFKHPCRVVKNLLCIDCTADENVDMMTAAILHDVVEDTYVSLNDLRQSGFPENVIEAVNVLTKREEDDYFHYVRKVKNNKIAKLVKDADLRDNMDLSRISHPEKKDLERVEKYTKAREILNG